MARLQVATVSHLAFSSEVSSLLLIHEVEGSNCCFEGPNSVIKDSFS